MCSMMKWCPFKIICFINIRSKNIWDYKKRKMGFFLLVTYPHLRRNWTVFRSPCAHAWINGSFYQEKKNDLYNLSNLPTINGVFINLSVTSVGTPRLNASNNVFKSPRYAINRRRKKKLSFQINYRFYSTSIA
jgi:hypothetical protein